MRYDEPSLVWTVSDHHTLVNAGERDIVWKVGGEKKGTACKEQCDSEPNPKPNPKPQPSSADDTDRGVA
jgi:hypothetical protein